jgi:hypothetical protein
VSPSDPGLLFLDIAVKASIISSDVISESHIVLSSYDEGVLSRSMKSGVISLIYKKKGDRRCIRNYRPISLLQVDYTILARILGNIFLRES